MIHELLHCSVILVYKSNYRKKWGLKITQFKWYWIGSKLGLIFISELLIKLHIGGSCRKKLL